MNPIETQHYRIKNLQEFKERVDRLRKYINDIEKIFPTIEEIFGSKWEPAVKIDITLKDSAGGVYHGMEEKSHKVDIGVNDKIINDVDFPENLWGCLLHETLHAFMYPIIYRSKGYNELNGGIKGEVFTLSFQYLVYLRLREKGILSEELFVLFCQRLENEVGEGRELYETYKELFLKEPFCFARFIQLLDSSEEPLLKNETFYENLTKVKKLLFPQEA